ncbi:MAG: DNA polymerase III subunit gamma/tau [Patescibacteria group bacterium]|nr:DNA polymerase III subunit gamma/tau [Patescibacteria group bacterium]
MSLTLYRKYRPKNFEELVGQNHIKETLLNEIKSKNWAHAYLFNGPKGVGKTTTARLLAKAVNCQQRKEGEPCNQCQACQEIIKGQALDVIEIDAASHTQVDNIRENIIPNARTVPSRLDYKVFIIDEVHMLSLSAFNALLKILEEPPAHVIFILATTEIHKLPETIISRCQRFDFQNVNPREVKKRLEKIAKKEKIKIDDEVLLTIASLAEGSIRDAEVILGQVFSLGEKKITKEVAELVLPRSNFKLIYQLFKALIKKDKTKSIEIINQLIKEGVDIKNFTKQFLDFLRKVLLIKVDKRLEKFSYFEVEDKSEEDFYNFIKRTDLKVLNLMINKLLKYKKEISYVSIPQLPLELFAIDICHFDEESKPIDFKNNNDNNSHSSQKNTSSLPKKKSESSKDKNKSNINTESQKLKSNKNTPVLKKAYQKWPNIISHLNKKNHSLALVLKNCQPIEHKEDKLIIGCNFKFHQERLSDNKNIVKIEKVIGKFFKKPLRIKFVISQVNINRKSSKLGQKDKKNEDFEDVLKSFDGQVLKA